MEAQLPLDVGAILAAGPQCPEDFAVLEAEKAIPESREVVRYKSVRERRVDDLVRCRRDNTYIRAMRDPNYVPADWDRPLTVEELAAFDAEVDRRLDRWLVISGGSDDGPADADVRPLAKTLALLEKYVVMSPEQRLVVALWIVHTHCVEHFEQTPYLTVTSPQRQCGKSRLLDVLGLLVARPWPTIMPSEAVVFRTIASRFPTLLLDEVDAIFAPKTADRYEGLRAILNAGHRRGNTVPRLADFGQRLEEFAVFCPKVLAGIGVLPDTITDRSIPIRLQRKTRSETVERFYLRKARVEASALFNGMAQWAAANGPALGAARPVMPEELSDRMVEGCEPLVAIADALGYGDEARAALVALLTGERDDERERAEQRLLIDIRDLFQEKGVEHMGIAELTAALLVNGNGWHTWYGRGLSPQDVRSMLKPYGLHTANVRLDVGVRKCYRRSDLYPVFERYLPAEVLDEAL